MWRYLVPKASALRQWYRLYLVVVQIINVITAYIVNGRMPKLSLILSCNIVIWRRFLKCRNKRMKQKETGICYGFTISQLAHKLTLKHYHELDRHEHIRCKVREMGCLLVDLKQEHKIQSTADALHPLNFDAVVSSVRHVAGFTEDSHSHHLHLNLVICLKSVQVCRLPKPCIMAVMKCKKCWGIHAPMWNGMVEWSEQFCT